MVKGDLVLEASRQVTFLADSSSEYALGVGVLMAGYTSFNFDRPELPLPQVTLLTGEFLMKSRERKNGLLGVIELKATLETLPTRGGVAILTTVEIPFPRLSVIAAVTALARVRRIEVAVSIRLRSLSAVTLPALDILMSTGKRPPRESMVECPFVQLSDVMMGTHVLTMALITGFLAGDSGVVPTTVAKSLLRIFWQSRHLAFGVPWKGV